MGPQFDEHRLQPQCAHAQHTGLGAQPPGQSLSSCVCALALCCAVGQTTLQSLCSMQVR